MSQVRFGLKKITFGLKGKETVQNEKKSLDPQNSIGEKQTKLGSCKHGSPFVEKEEKLRCGNKSHEDHPWADVGLRPRQGTCNMCPPGFQDLDQPTALVRLLFFHPLFNRCIHGGYSVPVLVIIRWGGGWRR